MRAAVNTRRAEVWKQHNIDADQALHLIALVAKIDIALAYGEDGKLLPVSEWPLEMRLCVKEVRGDGTVKLLDPLRARELIAQAGGKLNTKIDLSLFDAAGYLVNRTNPDGTPAPRKA